MVGVGRDWLLGRPLTDFGRRRPNLPLPLERGRMVERLADCMRMWLLAREASTGRPLTLPSPSGEGLRRGGGVKCG